MDFNSALIAGAGGLIVGLVIGYSMGGSGEDLAEAGLSQTRELSAQVEALSERVGGVEGAVGALVKAQTEGVQGLGARIDGIVQQVSGQVDALGGGVSEAMKTQIQDLRGQLAGLIGGAPAGGASGEATGVGVGTGVGSGVGSGVGNPATPGSTVTLADGKLRVFLSAADPAAGTARVAINGQTLVSLAIGNPLDVDGCSVSLTGFDAAGAALIDGGC